MREWKQCSRGNPCPICGSQRRCSVALSGEVAKCTNIFDGPGVLKEGDDSTGPYAIHKLDGAPTTPRAYDKWKSPDPARADAADLNRVYNGLLTRLKLDDGHREGLRVRGLDDATIDTIGFKTMPWHAKPRTAIAAGMRGEFGAALLQTVPGFEKGAQGIDIVGSGGVLIPVRSFGGNVVALKVRTDRSGAKYVWFSGGNGPTSGSPPHFPAASVAKKGPVWILTEGELKAEVVAALGDLPVIGMSGVSSSRAAMAQLRMCGCETVRIALDVDVFTNENVSDGLECAAHNAVAAGLALEVAAWPADAGKGLDDVLNAQRGGDVVVYTGRDAWRIICDARRTTGEEPRDESLKAAGEEPPPPEPPPAVDPNDPLANLAARVRADRKAAFTAEVLRALIQLRRVDRGRYVELRAELRAAGVPLGELDGAMDDRQTADARESRAARERAGDDAGNRDPHERSGDGFTMVPGRITFMSLRDDEDTTAAYFSCVIRKHVVVKDGTDQSSLYELEAKLPTGFVKVVRIPAEDFGKPRWETVFGPEFALGAGSTTRDRACVAIKILSQPIEEEVAYKFTGWTKIGGKDVYLHATGAIGENGNVEGARSHLDNAVLERFELPEPAETPADSVEDIRACFDVMVNSGAPDVVMLPAFAAVWRSVLGVSPVSLFYGGKGQSGKSFVASIAQMHFGKRMHRRAFPVTLKHGATGPAPIGRMRAMIGDAVFVMDDYLLSGNQHADAQITETLDAVMRLQYNGSGKQRLSRDTKRVLSEPEPRCLTIVTGEQLPNGHSLNTRFITVKVHRGDLGKLDQWEAIARSGTFARGTAAHIKWLAGRLTEARAHCADKAHEAREKLVRTEADERSAEMLAELVGGLRSFLRHALEVGAITKDEARGVIERMRVVTEKLRDDQTVTVHDQDPVTLFMDAISDLLRSGGAHLRSQRKGGPPHVYRDQLGWLAKRATSGTPGPYDDPGVEAHGVCIGYVSEDGLNVLLEPGPSHKVARAHCAAAGSPLALTLTALIERLVTSGKLAVTDLGGPRNTPTTRRRINGVARSVLIFPITAFVTRSDASGQDEAAPESAA